jgi:putative GTP pyrophosphokinase
MNNDLLARYTDRYTERLRPLAERLQTYVSECLKGLPRVDRITARAKTPESFAKKAAKRTSDGRPKYSDPLLELQDLVGVRVIVFYSGDVESAVDRIRRYLVPIEHRRVVPDSHWAFGYAGLHMILAVPEDVITDEGSRPELPDFFELQIKTLFQHAWSEANHDLGYKPVEELAPEQQRRLAFAAAQAWGADREFKELQAELQA